MASTSQDVTFGLTFTPATQVYQRSVSNTAYAFSAPAVSRSYTVNGLNQYASVGGTSFSYDDRGNLTSDGSRTFGYDLENRLTCVGTSCATMTLAYDPKGRMQQTSGATAEHYLYDGDSLLAEYNATGTLLRRYVPGRGVDENLVWFEGSGLTTPNWLHTDQQGSVVAASNSSGVATIYAYSPSGEPSGGWVNAPATPIFRYTGQAALPQIGLYYYKARMYDPVLGRFLQTDPIGYKDEWNLYAYVGNDPVNKSDPSGNCPMCWGGGIGVLIGGGLEMTDQYLRYREIRDWGAVGEEALIGGIAGATGAGAGQLLLKAEALSSLAGAAAPAVAGSVSGAVDASAHGKSVTGGVVRGAVFGYLGGKAGEKLMPIAGNIARNSFDKAVNRGAARGDLVDQLIQSGALSRGSKSGGPVAGASAASAAEHGTNALGDAAAKYGKSALDAMKERFCLDFKGSRVCQ